jgi:cysteine synthase
MRSHMSEPEMDIAESILDLIGNTPMVKLPRLSNRKVSPPRSREARDDEPGGSVKDRPAVAMIDAAERKACSSPGHDRRADLGQHGSRSSPSSRTAWLQVRVSCMTDKVAPEKIAFLRAYGADSRRVPCRGRA